MRNFLLALGTVALTATACGGFTSIGNGHDRDRDGGVDGGGAAGAGGASRGGSGTGARASGGTGGRGSGGAGGVDGCGAVGNCPSIMGCPQGQETATRQCCPVCVPMGMGGASGGNCKSASDCAVPAICKICSDGSSSCAQGDCVNGQCTTSFPPCPVVDAGGTPQCKADTDCPQLGIACQQCSDGSTACPSTKCVNGQCNSSLPSCPAPTDLKWFATCGGPVCRSPDVPTGAPLCDPAKGQAVGKACSPAGATCDPGGSCQGNLLCATKDPKSGAGCPVSRAKYKEDIEYLSQDERATLAHDLQSIPLVRYRYKDAPAREHLGFIIEDVEPSPSVDSPRDQVDLYGYTSMAVAALQQEHAEIEALKHEVQSLKAELRRASKAPTMK